MAMSTFLVAYGTGEGQTAKVTERIVSTLEDRGHEAVAVDLGKGNLERSVETFVREHGDVLGN
jgi:menaquinone-dependent protoporphyrinogen oxidase